MASLASNGSRLVEKYEIVSHGFLEGVARRAGYILMTALQGKRRFLVIEKRRLPLVAVVAGCAIVCAPAKLLGVRILMALTASGWSGCELNVGHGQLHVWRLVAIGARDGAMRTLKRKLRA